MSEESLKEKIKELEMEIALLKMNESYNKDFFYEKGKKEAISIKEKNRDDLSYMVNKFNAEIARKIVYGVREKLEKSFCDYVEREFEETLNRVAYLRTERVQDFSYPHDVITYRIPETIIKLGIDLRYDLVRETSTQRYRGMRPTSYYERHRW